MPFSWWYVTLMRLMVGPLLLTSWHTGHKRDMSLVFHRIPLALVLKFTQFFIIVYLFRLTKVFSIKTFFFTNPRFWKQSYSVKQYWLCTLFCDLFLQLYLQFSKHRNSKMLKKGPIGYHYWIQVPIAVQTWTVSNPVSQSCDWLYPFLDS